MLFQYRINVNLLNTVNIPSKFSFLFKLVYKGDCKLIAYELINRRSVARYTIMIMIIYVAYLIATDNF